MVDKWNRGDIIIIIMFLAFAALQWNDPDSGLWILIYMSVVVLAVLINLSFNFPKLFKLHLILSIIGSLFVTRSYFTNLQSNASDFMSPEQEGLRELLGIYIVLAFSVYYGLRAYRKRRA